MERKRRIAILGSTGSIGTQTLDVVREHPDLFEVELISCRDNVDALVRQAVEFDVNHAVICNEEHYHTCADALAHTDTKVFAGIRSLCDLVTSDRVDIVVASMVGFSGLEPTLAAVRAGKIIALANKETLVAAGAVVMAEARRCHAPILPVDSEHSAIFQCLLAAQGNAVDHLLLTASGGPFRTWEKDRIAGATKEMALKHPRWSMGAKITIDSATMMNKGFEVIEACWLFDMPPGSIRVLVHPESIIHSMIAFEDGAVLAQLACPDMRQPIQFALGFPERHPLSGKKLDLAEVASVRLVGDRDSVMEIVENLLTNAAKYAAHAGPVSVHVARAAGGSVAEVCVADCGPGLPAAQLRHVFDRDWRASNDLTKSVGGWGVGLAFARDLARDMGGELSVAARPGGGCAFTLVLPIGENPEEEKKT